MTYDAIGNPLTYNGYAMTWNGRQLMEMSMNGGQFTYSFTYNADGIRTSKNSNGTLHTYTLNGSQIVSETVGNVLLVYLYDESGAIFRFSVPLRSTPNRKIVRKDEA